ncbi:hypothetical protein HRbin02_01579 [Candidatus Calditenuaceae archaeon HR02]|nr:hypothetical protein HRbin02_01579 [Candidatus Calditenuaceae archaeon HR02]
MKPLYSSGILLYRPSNTYSPGGPWRPFSLIIQFPVVMSITGKSARGFTYSSNASSHPVKTDGEGGLARPEIGKSVFTTIFLRDGSRSIHVPFINALTHTWYIIALFLSA